MEKISYIFTSYSQNFSILGSVHRLACCPLEASPSVLNIREELFRRGFPSFTFGGLDCWTQKYEAFLP